MSHRQFYLGITGLLLVLIGLAALWFPVYLGQYDQYGIRINCGNGLGFQLSQAPQAAPAATSQCGSALLIRRLWAIPAVAVGWVLVCWVAIKWMREETLSDEPEHLVPHPEIGWF